MNYRSAIETARKIGPIHDPILREAVVKVLMNDGGEPVKDTLLKKASTVIEALSKLSDGVPRQRKAVKRAPDRESDSSASHAIRQLFGNRAAGDGADSPAAKLIAAHFSKQAKELSDELRKRIALDAIDKSDKRTIGTAGPVPLSALAAARIEKQHWTDMNPYSIANQKPPQVPGKPLSADDATVEPSASPRTADPMTTPAQIAQNGYLQSRQAVVLASMSR